jgi:hypothetical protein
VFFSLIFSGSNTTIGDGGFVFVQLVLNLAGHKRLHLHDVQTRADIGPLEQVCKITHGMFGAIFNSSNAGEDRSAQKRPGTIQGRLI